MAKDILAVIQENMSSFSKGQRLIANYILESYDKAAFMTACKLGKTVNVSESTVVRFAAELGYDGYPSMQRALQEMIRNKLTAVQRIEVSNDRIGDHDVMSMVMQSDIEKIRLTLEETDRDSFQQAVDAISGAKRIYILGVRSASTLASFISFYFTFIFDNVVHVDTNSISEVFEQVIRIEPGDVF
ncbi:MAG: MurR/RpiR family transcriptional regulator, partial [Oscillospiraceae bacterium]|nr:MurR/RpiR family transcriptional regulator [Oscillospiraceae bacterium]